MSDIIPFPKLLQMRMARINWPWRTARVQRQSLLRLLAVATDTAVPLAPLLSAWAADERGVQSTRVRRLARLLAQGVPLPEAVEQVPGVLKNEDILAMRFGAQSGTLAASLRDAADSLEPSPLVGPSARKTLAWFIAFGMVAFVLVSFMTLKIVPSYQSIFEDFDLDLPKSSLLVINFAEFFARYWYLPVLAIMAMIWGTLSFRGHGWVRALVDRISGGIRPIYSADLLRKLSVASEAGRPLAGSLSTLARYHFDPAARRKLLFVRNEVEHGADAWQSMAAERLITPVEAAALHTADRLDNRPWVLRQLAAAKRARIEHRRNRLQQLVFPVVTIAFGIFVLFQAVGMMAPLINLIANLSG
jgi:type II secretory pathway component PulF